MVLPSMASGKGDLCKELYLSNLYSNRAVLKNIPASVELCQHFRVDLVEKLPESDIGQVYGPSSTCYEGMEAMQQYV